MAARFLRSMTFRDKALIRRGTRINAREPLETLRGGYRQALESFLRTPYVS